jgi:flagellar basal body-associated protein FliL
LESSTRSNWIVFVVILAIIFTLGVCVNVYRLFAKDKEPEAATSVMINNKPLKKFVYSSLEG